MNFDSIAALHTAYHQGSLTPVDLIAACYQRIDEHDDPALFIHLRNASELVEEAELLRNRQPDNLPLYGVPVVIKDNIDFKGVPTTCACPGFSYIPDRHAAVVDQLQAAGALILGKTNLDQFATGLVGTRSPYGTPRNPGWPRLIPGGSSSGSAAAVAAGIALLSLGTDTAGSGRVPAAANGLVGCKPSCGLVSTRGVVPAVRSLDCVSIFTRTTADAAVGLQAIGAFDPMDPFARRTAPERADAVTTILVPAEADRAFDDPRASRQFAATCERLAHNGYQITPIDWTPFAEAADLLYGGPWVAERYAAVGDALEAGIDGTDPTVSNIILGGANYSARQAYEAGYRLRELQRQVEPLFTDGAILLTPTVPGIPTPEQVAADPVATNTRLGTYTNFCNLLDLCALALPMGEGSDHEHPPAHVTLFAPAWQDLRLLHVAEGLRTAAAGAEVTT